MEVRHHVAEHGDIEFCRRTDLRYRSSQETEIFDPLSSLGLVQLVQFHGVTPEDQDAVAAIIGVILEMNLAGRQNGYDICILFIRAHWAFNAGLPKLELCIYSFVVVYVHIGYRASDVAVSDTGFPVRIDSIAAQAMRTAAAPSSGVMDGAVPCSTQSTKCCSSS